MFTKAYRELIRNSIIQKAIDDQQIVSAAVIGSYARNEVDEYSDIDLTFGINEILSLDQMLERYRKFVLEEFSGEYLFTLEQDHTKYIVFLLPGCLQVDLSFTKQQEFGPKAYPFNLLFGEHNGEKKPSPHLPIKEKFGLTAHHILRTKVCLERNKINKAIEWQDLAKKYIRELNINFTYKARNQTKSYTTIQEQITYQVDSLAKIQDSNIKSQKRIIQILQSLKL